MSDLAMVATPTISIVTPTLDRPDEVSALLKNLATQDHCPLELVLVDASRTGETHAVVRAMQDFLPYRVEYIVNSGGTAIQRNVGIQAAQGEFIAFIDDDMVLEPEFFTRIIEAFAQDPLEGVAAVAGYVTNQYFDGQKSGRWAWYRRLGLFTTYEPGCFDYDTGYVINRYMQPPHDGIREIDCMGANCAVWRRKVFERGLRFSPFFVDYGVGEDAHIALSAKKLGWSIWECGRARCVHQQSARARTNRRRIAWKTAVNYRFLFIDIVRQRTPRQELRFWGVQLVELAHEILNAIRWGRAEDWASALGKFQGITAAIRLHPSDEGIGGRAGEPRNSSTVSEASFVTLPKSRLAETSLVGLPDTARVD